MSSRKGRWTSEPPAAKKLYRLQHHLVPAYFGHFLREQFGTPGAGAFRRLPLEPRSQSTAKVNDEIESVVGEQETKVKNLQKEYFRRINVLRQGYISRKESELADK